MSRNPYAPPEADVADVDAPSVPKQVLRDIRNAWIAGLISGSLTLVYTLTAVSGTSVAGYTAWQAFDAALAFGLTFGIFVKSRVCAVLMLVYFVASKLVVIWYAGIEGGRGVIIMLLFLFYFAMGIRGTFAYHRLSKPSTSP